AGDPRKTERDASLLVGAPKPTSISPRHVEIIITAPSNRPQIAPWRRSSVRFPVPVKTFDNRAGRVGRFCFPVGRACRRSERYQRSKHPKTTNRSLPRKSDLLASYAEVAARTPLTHSHAPPCP